MSIRRCHCHRKPVQGFPVNRVLRCIDPVRGDFDSAIELFPAASYQYVIYGMGFRPNFSDQSYLYKEQQQAKRIIQRNQQMTQQMLKTLPSHRDYIERWLASA